MSCGKKRIKDELKNKKALFECAKRFNLVGDMTKMQICWLLCKHKELSVSEIAEMLNVSPSLVSHALKRLREKDLISKKREGKRNLYWFSDKALKRSLLNLVNYYERKI